MIGAIKNHLNLYIARQRWRKANSHNETYMGGYFNPEIVSVGKDSYGLLNVINHGREAHLKIGNYCSIGPEVIFVLSGEHSIDNISTFPFKTHVAKCQKYEAHSKGNIRIGDDVWIGARATIMSGVHIHQGAVIAAGAVVVKDVPPYAVIAGVPAQVIKKRFDDKTINMLLRVDFSGLSKNDILEHLDDLYVPLTSEEQLKWLPKIHEDTNV